MFNAFNPCNIRYSANQKWLGQIGRRNGFCYFSSCFYGYRAFLVLCRTYYNKYNIRTISDFVHRFAPTSENNTSAYIGFVVSNLAKHNIDDKFDLSRKRLYWLAYYVTIFENGHIPFDVVEQLDKCFNVYAIHICK